MLKALADTWKFRLRMALALRDTPPGATATPAELDRLVALQTACWQQHPPLQGEDARRALRELNGRCASVFIFSVRARRVQVWRKVPVATQDPARAHEQRSFARRARLYQAFIRKVLGRHRSAHDFDFALDVNDIPEDSAELPIFGFQKHEGARNLLMPDVDFFHSKWYRREHDPLAYEEKANSACFVGSSTGGWLSEESIRRHETPRLRAAAHFHGHPAVSFRISNAVHCLSEEAKALLMRQPYFSAYAGWDEQLRHRFLISIDGNGAACSRLVKGLLSHSAVIKYASPYGLYYFPALQPGRDYLPAEKDEDVERFIDREAAQPGAFKDVALSGRRFALKYLMIGSVMDYTARLLAAYAGLPARR